MTCLSLQHVVSKQLVIC